jgi:glycosyltransferase involved in cell wall biosynthesis
MPTLVRGPYMQPLFKEFSRLFPNTVVFTANWPGYLRGYEASFMVQRLRGFKFVALKQNENGASIGFTRAPISVLREVGRFRPSVIFTESFTIWTLYALLYKCWSACRVVAIWDGTAPGTAYLGCPWRLWVRRVLARYVDAVITNSREGARYLRDILAIPESKVVRHPYQVPERSALCSADNLHMPSKADLHPVFLFVGSIISRKGWRYLLEAVALLVKSGIECFSVVLAGDGEQKDDLLRMAAALGLQKIVRVIGEVPYEELGGLFAASDVFVLPTLEDVWAVVVLEAMAFGKAVLCSLHAGASEMVQHGASGFLFDPRAPGELADYMARFIQRPELIGEFGRRSKEVICPYTPARAAEVLGALVLGLLGRTERQFCSEHPPQEGPPALLRPRGRS